MKMYDITRYSAPNTSPYDSNISATFECIRHLLVCRMDTVALYGYFTL